MTEATPLRKTLMFLIGACLSAVTWAQAYPERPVKLALPFPPGGSADSVARDLAERLKAQGGGTFLVENRPGAAGNLATAHVVKAPNDGYTLLVGVTGALAINPELYGNLGYQPETDLVGISMLAQAPVVVVASPQSGITTMQQLVSRARAEPGKLSYATNGRGTSHHLAGELFNIRAEISMVNIPYSGTPGALQDIAAGRIEIGFLDLTAAMPLISAGRIVALATTGATRPPALPNVPTVAESGFAGFDAPAWWAVVAPARVPAAVLKQMNEAINAVLRQPDVGARLAGQGIEVRGGSPDSARTFIEGQITTWAKVVKDNDIKAD